MNDKVSIYAFYNNKGGVGKTTLSSNVAAIYAERNPNVQVLVIDMCPQANISQFLLGGGEEGYRTNQSFQSRSSRKNIVGFIDWLLKGNDKFTSINQSYKTQVQQYNKNISSNVYLIAGDSFLESMSLSLNYAVINPANINAWKNYMTAIRRLCDLEFNKDVDKKYDRMVVFIDCNPSFSIYTQMALVSADKLIIPMMADFSSVEGIKGIMTLLYDEYPTSALKTYAENIMTFNKQIDRFKLPLPLIDTFVFNNYTCASNGIAKAYNSLKKELVKFCSTQYENFPQYFVPKKIPKNSTWENVYISDVKDFHSIGKVSSTLGIPIVDLDKQSKYEMPDGESINVQNKMYLDAVEPLNKLVDIISMNI